MPGPLNKKFEALFFSFSFSFIESGPYLHSTPLLAQPSARWQKTKPIHDCVESKGGILARAACDRSNQEGCGGCRELTAEEPKTKTPVDNGGHNGGTPGDLGEIAGPEDPQPTFRIRGGAGGVSPREPANTLIKLRKYSLDHGESQ